MMRKCHLNTCPVGVATQDPELRKRFTGKPEHVVNYFFFVAEEIRELMAKLGYRRFDDMIGQSQHLNMRKAIDHWKARGLDYSRILHKPDAGPDVPVYHCQTQDHGLDRALDNELIRLAQAALEKHEPVRIDLPVRNTNRSVGAMLSGRIARRYGHAGLPEDTISITLRGTAGQSFGAFVAHGVSIELIGEGNDYVGKGMSGGRIVLTTGESDRAHARRNVICGNACLYGATGGELFANGQAGERFAVRNSGAQAVIEGAGHHACEYMTGGTVVIMGPFGPNLAAGMTGGELFVLDPNNQTERYLNREFVDATPLEEQQFDAPRRRLKALVSSHVSLTGSEWGRRVLDSWEMMLPNWIYIVPRNLAASNDISQQDVPLRLVKA